MSSCNGLPSLFSYKTWFSFQNIFLPFLFDINLMNISLLHVSPSNLKKFHFYQAHRKQKWAKKETLGAGPATFRKQNLALIPRLKHIAFRDLMMKNPRFYPFGHGGPLMIATIKVTKRSTCAATEPSYFPHFAKGVCKCMVPSVRVPPSDTLEILF